MVVKVVPLLWWHSVRSTSSKSQSASQPAGPWSRLWGQGGSVCPTEAMHVQFTHKNNKCIFCGSMWVCMHAQSRGPRVGAYINHKLSGTGSCTSNEMVQMKVCVCMCVCLAALPLGEQAEDQCQIWLPSVLLAEPQGHFQNMRAHRHDTQSK